MELIHAVYLISMLRVVNAWPKGSRTEYTKNAEVEMLDRISGGLLSTLAT